jgi:hypothetical protein
MNIPRCYLSVAVLGDMVYATGGYDGHRHERTAERYDYRRNQWSMIAPMNVQRSDANAATLNGKIYVACVQRRGVYELSCSFRRPLPFPLLPPVSSSSLVVGWVL